VEIQTFLQVKLIVPDAFLRNRELFVARFIHEMKPIGITVQKGYGRNLHVRFGELLTGTEALLLDRSVEQILQSGSYHRTCSACRRCRKENVEYVVGFAVDFDQHFLLQLVRSNECHEPYLIFWTPISDYNDWPKR